MVADEELDGSATGQRSAPTRRWPAVLAYVLLGALLVFLVRPADIASSYEIGRSTGTLLISIAISYGIWSLIRRARRSEERWSPWILVIALFVATLLKLVPQGDTQGTSAPAAASVATLTAQDVFVDIPGLRYEAVPPARLERIEETYFADPAAAESLLDVDSRLVFEGRRQVGVITVVFSTPEAAASEDFEAGLFSGFEDAVEAQGGGPITPHKVAGIEARGGPTSQGYALSFTRDNAAITVVGGDRQTAELIADALLASSD